MGSADDSELTGMGQDAMMEFIKTHFGGILGPFSEQLGELHQSIALTNANLEDVSARADTADLAEAVRDLRAGLETTNRQVAALEERVTAFDAQLKETQGDVQNTNASLSALESGNRATLAQVKDLQGELVSSNHAMGQLRAGLGDVEAIVKKLGPAIEQQSLDVEGLSGAHRATDKLLRELKKSSEADHKDLQKSVQAIERARRLDATTLATASDALAELRTSAENTKHRVETQGQDGLATRALLAPLKEKCEQACRAAAVQQHQHNEAMKQHKEAMDKLVSLNSKLENLDTSVGIGEGGLKGGGTLMDRVLGIDALLEQTEGSIECLRRAMDSHADQLSSCEQRTSELEGEQPRVQQTISSFRERFRTIESLLELNTEKDAERTEQEAAQEAAQNLMKQTMHGKLAVQAEELEKTNAALQRTGGELGNACRRLEVLEGEIASTSAKVSKLSSGLDATKEYWKGLTRGFRETSERGDLVPTKGAPLLPSVAKTVPLQPLQSARSR